MRTFFHRRPGPIRLACVVALFLGGVSAVRGDDVLTGPPVLRQVGFLEQYKVGKWTPVEVELTTAAPAQVRLVLDAPDPSGNLASFPTPERRLEPGTHRLSGFALVGRLDGTIRARVQVRTGEVTREWPVAADADVPAAAPLRQSVRLIATLGHPKGLVPEPGKRRRNPSPAPVNPTNDRRVVELDDAAQLPRDVTGYDSLDVLLIGGGYELDEPRSAALRAWVQLGGHLVVAVGRDVAGLRDSRLSEWLPVEAVETITLRDLKPVENRFERSTRLVPPGGRVSAARLRLRSPKTERWEILIGDEREPLLVRAAVGMGKVTVLALDLDRPPLSTWSDLPALASRLVSDRRDGEGTGDRRTGGALARSGVTDLATQLHAAQEQFRTVERLPLWSVLLLMLGYLLLIGPLDYVLVHRLLRRPRLTWLTFPVAVAAAAALTIWGARQTNGRQMQLNQVDVVDLDAASGRLRSQSWLTLYSPGMERYAVAARPRGLGLNDDALRMGWAGVPESGYGGLYRSGGFRLGSPEYRFADGATAVENLPVPLWGTGNLTVTDRGTAADMIEADLSSSGTGRLLGTLRHHLPGAVSDWMIAYNKRVYLPSDEAGNAVWPPDVELRIDDRSVRQPELGFYLTRSVARQEKRHGSGEEIRLEQGRYEPLRPGTPPETQLYDILQMMTFHQAAGGTAYTGLAHESLREFDLSDLVLDLHRAVLFARVDLTAFDVTINGQPTKPGRHFAFVRIVLPVARSGD